MDENIMPAYETFESRLKRFQDGSPIEVIETLLNSINNYFNNEMRCTPAKYQPSLLILGIHAASLTIGEAFFDQRSPLENYKRFLEAFVDGDTADTSFSTIADSIHNWRNVLAHQWLGSGGYRIDYDYEMNFGWVKRADVICINPEIYCEKYLSAFGSGGKLWDYLNFFADTELEDIKRRLIKKYCRS